VRERIGSGSHGVVFRAVHADRPETGSYALKLALEPGDARFEREARLLSLLRHPSVPGFEGSGCWTSPRGEAYPYVVMQWVEGLSLYAWAEEHGLTLRQVIEQLAQVARALEATHRHGVHRDVKGSNIRVNAEGHAVLLDFGSCWYKGASPLTDRAMPPGTRCYLSPQLLFFEMALELGAGRYYEAQPADDVYALGITAYRLLAGAYPPREPDTAGGTEGAVRLVAPRGLSEACPELSALILRMLSEDPKARGSAKQVAEELERLLEHPRPALERPWVGNASRQPTEKVRPPVPRWYAPREWASRLARTGSFIVLVLLCGLLTRDGDRTEVISTGPQGKPQAEESPEADTSGMGKEAVASVSPGGTPPTSEGRLTRGVPDKPLPGQKRAPCDEQRGIITINGGCWMPQEGMKPPCQKDEYLHEGRCYFPILTSERAPTSKEPR
jgi:serine/threonine protein kinase